MKIISLRVFGGLVGLGALLVIGQSARSDDATDWANQQAQAQKEREEWQNQQAQAQRDREQAARDQQDRENWQNQIAQAQKEREDWYNQQAQDQKDAEDWRNQMAQAQKDREEWLNLIAQATPETPAAAQPAVVTPLPALPPPQPGAKTYTVTIHHGSQVTQTTFVMQDDGSWQPQ